MKQSIKLTEAGAIVRLPFEFCICCGGEQRLTKATFEETENNAVAQFAKLGGDVSVLAEHLLNKPHKVEATFCSPCLRRYRGLDKTSQLYYLMGLVLIFLGVMMTTIINLFTKSPLWIVPLIASVVVLVVVRIFLRFYRWRNSPKIRKINSRKVVLRIPGRGTYTCHR